MDYSIREIKKQEYPLLDNSTFPHVKLMELLDKSSKIIA